MEEIVKAIGWDGGNAEYWYKLADRQRSEVRGQKSGKDGSQKSEVGGQQRYN